MIRRLLFCAAFVTAFSTMNAQNDGVQGNSQLFNKWNAPVELTPGFMKAPSKINLADDEMLYGYCKENDPLGGLGAGGPATFDCAIFLPEDMLKNLAGSKITTIRVAMASASNLTNSKVWIAKELGGTQVAVKDVTLAQGWADFTLDTPYELDGDGVYIGYTTTLSKATTQAEQYPLGVTSTSTPNGLFLALNNGKWDDYAADYGTLMVQCVVKGNVPQYEAQLDAILKSAGVKGEKMNITGTITNKAKKDITSVDVTYVLDGTTQTITDVKVEPAIKSLDSGNFSFEVTTPDATGIAYSVSATIDKVNGQEDEYTANNKAEGTVMSLTKMPHRRIVMEEFTGSWCGYCPRGAVALEKLAEEYPEQFIGIAVHSGDNMATSSYNQLLKQVSGFPSSMLNRQSDIIDPYYGSNGQNFGIKNDVETLLKVPTLADLSLEAIYDGKSKTSLTVTSQTTFYYTSDKNPYKLAYVVLEDGVVGSQSNYFAGVSGLPEDLAFLKDKPSTIRDFEFNDVARNIHTCMGLSGSLEGAIKEDEAKTHTYKINLPSTIKNKDNLKLVVLLLDSETGEIMNANQIPLKDIEVGIENAVLKPFESTAFVENGILNVQTPTEGVMTLNVYSENGTLVASQVFEGNTTVPVSGLKGVHIVRITDGNNVSVQKVVF